MMIDDNGEMGDGDGDGYCSLKREAVGSIFGGLDRTPNLSWIEKRNISAVCTSG